MAPLYLCPLCEKKRLPDDLYFHAKGAKGAEFLFPFLSYSTLALKGSQTSLRQESAESLSIPLPFGDCPYVAIPIATLGKERSDGGGG